MIWVTSVSHTLIFYHSAPISWNNKCKADENNLCGCVVVSSNLRFWLRCLMSASCPPWLHTVHGLYCETKLLQAYLTNRQLIGSSVWDVFNYTVKWSVNGQSEICYNVLYISEYSAPKTTIPGLQWPRSYWITDMWNCVQRRSKHGISSCQCVYHLLSPIVGCGHHPTPSKNKKLKTFKSLNDTLSSKMCENFRQKLLFVLGGRH